MANGKPVVNPFELDEEEEEEAQAGTPGGLPPGAPQAGGGPAPASVGRPAVSPFGLDGEDGDLPSAEGETGPAGPETAPQPQQIQGGNVCRPMDKDTREELIRSHYTQAAVSLFDACRHLATLREECEQGEWEARVARIGISERTARLHVAMGRRLIKSEGVAGYLPDKVRAVLDLDEADQREIEEEGTLGGVGLDRYASMSRRKLEDHARRKDRQIGLGQVQVKKLKDRVEELEAQLAGAPRGMLDQALMRVHIALTQIMTFFADECIGLSDADAERLRREKGWMIYCAIMEKVNELRPVIVDEERLTH